ncbi:MAG: hypothetical protein U0641_11185 [Anaerolineae bacterium]
MSDNNVHPETTGGQGDVPGPLTQRSDIKGTSTGSGLGPGTMDGLDVSFGDQPREDEPAGDEMDEHWTGGERLTREQSNRQGTPRSDALNASPMSDDV